MLDKQSRIFVSGHRGMVGRATVCRLQAAGYVDVTIRGRDELDLIDQRAVHTLFDEQRPGYLFIAAAKGGGIFANNHFRANIQYQNLQIEANLIHGAHLADVQRLMFLGLSSIYPCDCPPPIKEEYLLIGPFEPTNEPYAIAKIAGIKLCDSYNRQYGRQYPCVMPTNLYGPYDNYERQSSHVLPALFRKAPEAKTRGDDEYVVWGSGTPRREFLYVDDLADACMPQMERDYNGPLVYVGTGEDITIRELVPTVTQVVGFGERITYDGNKPDGAPRKLLDVRRLADFSWRVRTPLHDGIRKAYDAAPYRQ